MASFFLDPPSFSEPNGNTVLLVLHNNIAMRKARKLQKAVFIAKWKTLSPLDQEIVYLIANVDKCTPMILNEYIDKSRPTIRNHLNKLMEENIIVEHSSSPRDPTKYYTLA